MYMQAPHELGVLECGWFLYCGRGLGGSQQSQERGEIRLAEQQLFFSQFHLVLFGKIISVAVADPKLLTSDPDPDSTCQVSSDPNPAPDPTFQVISDPDPTFQVISDPDPVPFHIFFVKFSKDFSIRSKRTN